MILFYILQKTYSKVMTPNEQQDEGRLQKPDQFDRDLARIMRKEGPRGIIESVCDIVTLHVKFAVGCLEGLIREQITTAILPTKIAETKGIMREIPDSGYDSADVFFYQLTKPLLKNKINNPYYVLGIKIGAVMGVAVDISVVQVAFGQLLYFGVLVVNYAEESGRLQSTFLASLGYFLGAKLLTNTVSAMREGYRMIPGDTLKAKAEYLLGGLDRVVERDNSTVGSNKKVKQDSLVTVLETKFNERMSTIGYDEIKAMCQYMYGKLASHPVGMAMAAQNVCGDLDGILDSAIKIITKKVPEYNLSLKVLQDMRENSSDLGQVFHNRDYAGIPENASKEQLIQLHKSLRYHVAYAAVAIYASVQERDGKGKEVIGEAAKISAKHTANVIRAKHEETGTQLHVLMAQGHKNMVDQWGSVGVSNDHNGVVETPYCLCLPEYIEAGNVLAGLEKDEARGLACYRCYRTKALAAQELGVNFEKGLTAGGCVMIFDERK